MKVNKLKVGIIGLGLIGSSILKGLANSDDYELYVCSNSSCEKALEYCQNSSNDIKIVSNCDIVFVCCELSKTVDTLEKLDEFLDKSAVVADVASIKKNLLNKKYNYNFILSHPMAGTEKSGFDAGFASLFVNCKWLIQSHNILLNKIISDLGAKPCVIDMKRHDELTAQISHLPTILSFLLFDTAEDNAKLIASSGFRDMTRLAETNSDLALNMFNNSDNILKYFDIIIKKMNELKKFSDSKKIDYFTEISLKRKNMYDKDGKNTL